MACPQILSEYSDPPPIRIVIILELMKIGNEFFQISNLSDSTDSSSNLSISVEK